MNKDKIAADARANRVAWDAYADEYQERHGEDLAEAKSAAWGVWRTPEADLGVLGDVSGLDVLEFGCGGAQWSIALAGMGAQPVGLDNSGRQLAHAARLMDESGVSFPLVQASGEFAPFADESFDIVLSDYGAMTWVDPIHSVREAGRVLRPGGLLAFCTTSPFLMLCWPPDQPEVTTTLSGDYFGLRRLEDAGAVEYQLPYGAWIRVFRHAGFVVEDLVEIQPSEDAESSYEGRPLEWARRFPAENIWKVRKPLG